MKMKHSNWQMWSNVHFFCLSRLIRNAVVLFPQTVRPTPGACDSASCCWRRRSRIPTCSTRSWSWWERSRWCLCLQPATSVGPTSEVTSTSSGSWRRTDLRAFVPDTSHDRFIRTRPSLFSRLHMLSELEHTFTELQKQGECSTPSLSQLPPHWTDRLEMTQKSFRAKEPILALRRALFSLGPQ